MVSKCYETYGLLQNRFMSNFMGFNSNKVDYPEVSEERKPNWGENREIFSSFYIPYTPF